MSRQIRKVHRPLLLSITDQFNITSVLSKVFERLVSVHLGRFMERSGVLPTTQFAYRTSVRVPYTAGGEWAGGSDCADFLQCSL